MFNIGLGELLLLGIIALIFIPAKDLPKIAQTAGRFLNDLKHASDQALGALTSAQRKSNSLVQKAEQSLQDIGTRVLSQTNEAPKAAATAAPAPTVTAEEPKNV